MTRVQENLDEIVGGDTAPDQLQQTAAAAEDKAAKVDGKPRFDPVEQIGCLTLGLVVRVFVSECENELVYIRVIILSH